MEEALTFSARAAAGTPTRRVHAWGWLPAIAALARLVAVRRAAPEDRLLRDMGIESDAPGLAHRGENAGLDPLAGKGLGAADVLRFMRARP